ncbi:hypothetical protein F0562_001610 [Nyssa sinensis]|uniref:Uncharacterized protein n=1 Tax=Nyssa sinensis TaxID=561372 RepID=A0A5J5C4M9_9ASTE|nr:hypothetical protein F0562_001610 [Nyssa sinensis]
MAGGAANEALKERITRLENFVGVPEDDEAVSLSISTEQHAIELVDLRKILDDFMTETNARVNNIIEDVMSLTDVVKINLKSLEDEVALVKNDHSKKEGKKKTGVLSALQLKTGLRKGEETYLAALVEIKPDTTVEVPDEATAAHAAIALDGRNPSPPRKREP